MINYRKGRFKNFFLKLSRSFYWRVNKLITIRFYHCFHARKETVVKFNSEDIDIYKPEKISTESLKMYLSNSEYDFSENFILEESKSNSECFGLFEGGDLISSVWCNSTNAKVNDYIEISIPDKSIYLFKAFVLKKYRGKNLNGKLTCHAINHYGDFGYKDFYTLVEVVNYPSLRSLGKLGFTRLGWFIEYSIWGKPRVILSTSCKKKGLSLHLF